MYELKGKHHAKLLDICAAFRWFSPSSWCNRNRAAFWVSKISIHYPAERDARIRSPESRWHRPTAIYHAIRFYQIFPYIPDDGKQNFTIAAEEHSNFVVFCHLGSIPALPIGQHKLWVVRSPELLEGTLQMQNPVQLNILPEPSQWSAIVNGTTATTTTIIATAMPTRKVALTALSARFANQLDQILVQFAANGDTKQIGILTGNGEEALPIECDQMAREIEELGGADGQMARFARIPIPNR